MPAGAIECADDNGVYFVAVDVVGLDLEPGVAAVVHLPGGVQGLDDDALLLHSPCMFDFTH